MATDVPAVLNAVRVLERIAQDWPHAVATRTLVEDLGLNRSTCYNILGTLQRAGWLTGHGDRAGWSLGSRLFALTGVSGRPLISVVQQELDQLSARLGLTVFAVERRDGSYAVVAKAERAQGVRITVSVGDTLPSSNRAITRAFHAWSDPEEVDRLVRRHGPHGFTSETAAVRPALHAALAATRAAGYGVSTREYDPSRSSVAAPVFDARGRVCVAVCSLGFSSELNDGNVARVGAELRDCGHRVTRRIGGAMPDAERRVRAS